MSRSCCRFLYLRRRCYLDLSYLRRCYLNLSCFLMSAYHFLMRLRFFLRRYSYSFKLRLFYFLEKERISFWTCPAEHIVDLGEQTGETLPWYTSIFRNSNSLSEESMGISLEFTTAVFRGVIIHGLFLAQARLLPNLWATLADWHSSIQEISRLELLFGSGLILLGFRPAQMEVFICLHQARYVVFCTAWSTNDRLFFRDLFHPPLLYKWYVRSICVSKIMRWVTFVQSNVWIVARMVYAGKVSSEEQLGHQSWMGGLNSVTVCRCKRGGWRLREALRDKYWLGLYKPAQWTRSHRLRRVLCRSRGNLWLAIIQTDSGFRGL